MGRDFLAPSMTRSHGYSAERASFDSVDIVRLTDVAHHVEVAIAPSIGNIAYDMRVHGKAILATSPANLSAWKANPTQAGIPFLAPWAGRMEAGCYSVGEKTYRTEGNQGLVLFASDWRVKELKADGERAYVTSRLEFWEHPEWMAQFPFAHSIEMTHCLANGVLEIRTTIENRSNAAMPLSIGFHPWYKIPYAARSTWKVHLPVRYLYELSKDRVPTGHKTLASTEDLTPTLGCEIDDVFGEVSPTDEISISAKGAKISVRFGPKFTALSVFAPATGNVICIEPMTAIPNAFNLARAGLYEDLQTIAPGESWTESFWTRATGF